MSLAIDHSQWVCKQQEALLRTLDGLEQMLSASESGRLRAWIERLGWALTEVEEALSRHKAAAESADGPFAREDLDGPTLSTTERRVTKLRQEISYFLEEARALRSQARDLERSFQVPAQGNARQEPAVDLKAEAQVLHQRGTALLSALRSLVERETQLVLQNFNTDIGAGD